MRNREHDRNSVQNVLPYTYLHPFKQNDSKRGQHSATLPITSSVIVSQFVQSRMTSLCILVNIEGTAPFEELFPIPRYFTSQKCLAIRPRKLKSPLIGLNSTSSSCEGNSYVISVYFGGGLGGRSFDPRLNIKYFKLLHFLFNSLSNSSETLHPPK